MAGKWGQRFGFAPFPNSTQFLKNYFEFFPKNCLVLSPSYLLKRTVSTEAVCCWQVNPDRDSRGRAQEGIQRNMLGQTEECKSAASQA